MACKDPFLQVAILYTQRKVLPWRICYNYDSEIRDVGTFTKSRNFAYFKTT